MSKKAIIISTGPAWIEYAERLSPDVLVPLISTLGLPQLSHGKIGSRTILSAELLNVGRIPEELFRASTFDMEWDIIKPHSTTVMAMFDRLEQDATQPKLAWAQRQKIMMALTKMWLHVIKGQKIDFAHFTDIPHNVSDYICYVACCETGTPTLIARKVAHFGAIYFQNRLGGLPIGSEFHRISMHRVSVENISSAVANLSSKTYLPPPYMVEQKRNEDYGSLVSFLSAAVRRFPKGGAPNSVKPKSDVRKETANVFIPDTIVDVYTMRLAFRENFATPAAAKQRNRLTDALRRQITLSRSAWAERKERRRNFVHKRELRLEYEKCIEDLDPLASKFIFFPLHYQPEATSLPIGGDFNNQELIVDLLSSAIPSGWKIFVKEHPSQLMGPLKSHRVRDSAFYRRLRAYRNVHLVDWQVDPIRYVEKSQAVATISGTVGLEALLRGTPVLLFGDVWWSKLPGVYSINSKTDIQFVFRDRRNGSSLPKVDTEILRERITDIVREFVTPSFDDVGASESRIAAIIDFSRSLGA